MSENPSSDSRDVAVVVGLVTTLREIDEHEDIPEGVGDYGNPSDRNVEWRSEHPAASVRDRGDGFVSGANEPVRFVPVLRCQHDLGVGLRERQSDLPNLVVSPRQRVSEGVAVERESSIEVRHAESDGIDLAKQGFPISGASPICSGPSSDFRHAAALGGGAVGRCAARHSNVIGAFTTERLRLRPLTLDDVDLLLDLNSDVEVMRYITGRPSRTAEIQEELEQAVGTRWLAFHTATGEFCGWVGAIPAGEGEYDVGWRFRRVAWGQGLASEATRALIDHLFADGATRVFAQTMAVNERSRAVMERLELRFVRTFHVDVDDPLPGTELGEVEYALDRREWETRSR